MRIKHLNKIINLQELTLDNNPLSTEKNYKRNILAQLVSLRKLDSKKVTVSSYTTKQLHNGRSKVKSKTNWLIFPNHNKGWREKKCWENVLQKWNEKTWTRKLLLPRSTSFNFLFSLYQRVILIWESHFIFLLDVFFLSELKNLLSLHSRMNRITK